MRRPVVGQIDSMPFVSGGILAEWGPPKAALQVVQQTRGERGVSQIRRCLPARVRTLGD